MSQSFDPMEDPRIANAHRLLPAWFTVRMMTDSWQFGLFTSSGHVILIETILDVHRSDDDELWLDVELLNSIPNPYRGIDMTKVLVSPTSRTMASVAVRHIVAAFELADT